MLLENQGYTRNLMFLFPSATVYPFLSLALINKNRLGVLISISPEVVGLLWQNWAPAPVVTPPTLWAADRYPVSGDLLFSQASLRNLWLFLTNHKHDIHRTDLGLNLKDIWYIIKARINSLYSQSMLTPSIEVKFNTIKLLLSPLLMLYIGPSSPRRTPRFQCQRWWQC